MSWSDTSRPFTVIAKIAELWLRAERLTLIRKIAAGEAQARQLGHSTTDFARAKLALMQPVATEPGLRVVPLPPSQRLAVKRLPGSMF